MSDSFPPHQLQHTRLLCPSLSPGACSHLCPLSQWCHPTISSSVDPFSSCLPSFPASGSFPMSCVLVWGGQITGASASVSVLPVNIQDWFPLRLTGLISSLSKGLSRVFSSTTIQKHQFLDTQTSLWSTSHIHWRRKWQPTPVLLPGKSHGWRRVAKSRTWLSDFLYSWLVWSPCCLGDSQESPPSPQFESINSLACNLLYGSILTFVHDY